MLSIPKQMLIYLTNLALTALLMTLSQGAFSQSLRFMTYNLRYNTVNDKENRWDLRKEKVSRQIQFFEPQVIGVQEALLNQVQYLDSVLADYTYLGVGRDDGKEAGEFSAIFYQKEQFQVVKQRTFWLSPTPDKPSVGWDAALERICTYALLEDRESKAKFWVFNTHFDHRGAKAREQSARLIVRVIDSLRSEEDYPVILMGDLNLSPETSAIQYLSEHLHDAYTVSEHSPFGPEATFNGFQVPPSKTFARIDYIFTGREGVRVEKYAVLSELVEGRFLSDHFPVLVDLIFTEN